MQYIGLVLLIFGFVFFCIAAWRDTPDRAKLIALGLACVTAAEIFGGVGRVLGGH